MLTSTTSSQRAYQVLAPPPLLTINVRAASRTRTPDEPTQHPHNNHDQDDEMHIQLPVKAEPMTATSSTCPFTIPSLATPTTTQHDTSPPALPAGGPVVWDWDVEHCDRKREKDADKARQKHHGSRAGAGIDQGPFEIDRKVLKDVVTEKMSEDVGRIVFIGSGTFNKAYLVTLVSGRQVVMRVSRRYMPRLKTSSEVATMHYLRTHSTIPVPDVYAYDSNPHNRLGAEYILMSKATGVPLSKVYSGMSYQQLTKLMNNSAAMFIPLFGHRFDKIGSLYLEDSPSASTSQVPSPGGDLLTPKPQASNASTPRPFSGSDHSTPKPPLVGSATIRPLSAALSRLAAGNLMLPKSAPSTVVGPIVSWPFFGSNRGELTKSEDIDRGPWSSCYDYLLACAYREIKGVIRENEGKAAPHRISLDPDEIRSSRHHHLNAIPGDESDASTEWDMSESERGWDEPGDVMYQDYRRMQRSTFLVAHMAQREQAVGEEMERFIGVMEKLGVTSPVQDGGGGGPGATEKEDFALDCHDLNLENVFVDEEDPSKITCILDWECTTTRPLWAAAHLPAFAQSSPFTARMYRHAVSHIASDPNASVRDAALASQWLANEANGARLRAAHRCVEWDGWEEGLVQGILGSVEDEGSWEQDAFVGDDIYSPLAADGLEADGGFLQGLAGELWEKSGLATGEASPGLSGSRSETRSSPSLEEAVNVVAPRLASPQRQAIPIPHGPKALIRPDERAQERELDSTGDLCGGRGGELGRRLEAWLYNVRGEEVAAGGEVISS